MDKNYFFRLAFVLSFTLGANILSAQDPAQEGAWSDPILFDLVPHAVANLPDGRLVTWSSKYKDDFGGGDGFTHTQIFDPTIGTDGAALTKTISQTNHDMFCPGISNLVDGRILVGGGSSSEKTSIYDPATEIWSPADNMNVPRGYQSNVTLSNGAVFTLGGSWSGAIGGKYGEIYSLATGWVSIPSVTGELLLDGNDPDLDEPVPSQKYYRSDNHSWLWAAPNGKIFHAGPGTDMHWIDVRDVDNPTVVNLGRRGDDTYAINGNTVMFDIGKLLKVGGSRSYSSGTPASDKAYVIDINSEVPVVTPVPGFKRARAMNSSVIFPNGKILVVGGIDKGEVFSDIGARYVGEIYDPLTNTWEDTAPMQVPRTYHSVAILMPDGRIFVGGGGLCGPCDVNHFDAEIYSPPYLFNDNGTLATRPTIQAPESADYNSTISVTGSSNIKSFSLIRFSSSSHTTNNEVRRIPVSFVEKQGGYDISIPDRNLLPPGYYMLFGLNKFDVPSIAESIQIGSNIPFVGANPNLVLDLKFDEGSGINVTDDSQYGNDAVIKERDNNKNEIPVTQEYWTNEGLFGNALEMDGLEFFSNSIVEVEYSESMASIKQNMTVMAWVYRDELDKNIAVLAHDYPKIFFGFHNSLYKWQVPTSIGGNVECYVGRVPLNKWVHLAATFDGAIGRLYVNGTEICSDVAGGELLLETEAQYKSSFTSSGFYDSTQPQSLSGITDEIDGRIDELKVFNKALTQQEIESFYAVGLKQNNPEVVVCPPNTITAQYKIGSDGDWQTGNTITAAEFDEVYIRAIVPSGDEYFVTLPFIQQNTFSSVDDFPNFEDTTAYRIDSNTGGGNGVGDGFVNKDNEGKYVLTTVGGCMAVIDLKIEGTAGCVLQQEYRINGTYFSGDDTITVNEGDEVSFSVLPNGLPNVTVTLPDGTAVDDNYTIGHITMAQAGTYTLSSASDCSVTLEVVVVADTGCNIVQEYRINGVFDSGADTITVNEGDNVALSILPNGIDFVITLPDGTEVNGDYVMEKINPGNAGTYTLSSRSDCSKTLAINVNPISGCNIIQEYRINGVFDNGADTITVNEGDNVAVSILPNGLDFTVTLPDGSEVNGDLVMGSIKPHQGGIYTLTTSSDCSKTLTINVIPISGCNIVQEYRVNGVFESGADTIAVNEGDDVVVSILPNGVDFVITLPNGSEVNGDLIMDNITPEETGVYTLTTSSDCSKTLTINVLSTSGCNIVQEYRINGVFANSEDTITLNDGDNLAISILPNGIEFTTTLPDGTVVNGDYLIEGFKPTHVGLYTMAISADCEVTLDVRIEGGGCPAAGTACDDGDPNTENDVEDGDCNCSGTPIVIVDPLPFKINGLERMVDAYAPGDQDNGTFEVQDNGNTLKLMGNAWKKAPLNYTITPNTVVSFDFRITGMGEIHGIGFDDDNSLDDGWAPRFFALAGTETYGIQDYRTYTSNGWTSFSIPVGEFFTGDFNFLVFGGDKDVDGANQESFFRNMMLTENAPPCTVIQEYRINGVWQSGAEEITVNEGDDVVLSILPNNAGVTITLPDGSIVGDDYELGNITIAQAGIYTLASDEGCSKTLNIIVVPVVSNDLLTINGVGEFVDAYSPGNQDNGSFEIQGNGSTLKLMGNAWKKAPFNYTITANTVMNFELRVTGMGEIHGIGFDNNNWLGGSLRHLFFELAGTQTYAIQDYRTYTGNDWQTISIPIGEHFTGDFNFLIFSADKDRNASVQESFFRNITFSEDAQLSACASSSAVVISTTSTTKIEAEDFCEKHGNVRTENSEDVGGGLNLGFIRNGDWLDYRINVPENGEYQINYRVASNWDDGGKISMMVNDELLGTVDVPGTGAWQTYTTVSNTISLSAGIQNIRVYATQRGWNLNWFELEFQVPASSSKAISQGLENGKWAIGESDDILINPNPSKGILDLYLGKMMNVSARVSIYNTVGKEVYSISYNKDHQDAETMDLSFLANGVYRIIVETDNNIYHKSVVIQK